MENNELETTEKKLALSKQLPMGEEAENIVKWATLMSDTKFYQNMVTAGGKNAILAIFLTARSLDVDPMMAISGGIFCVQGRTMLSSQLMNMMIRRNGHSIKKKIGTAEMCHLVGKRRDNSDEMESIFTIQMAERAGLTKNAVWKSFPERMLFSRALSNLAKDLFPDCIGNSLCEGELEMAEVEVIEPEPMDATTMKFINDFNLLDLECDASKFINAVVVNTGETRSITIKNCAREPERFQNSLNKFIEKMKPKQEQPAK